MDPTPRARRSIALCLALAAVPLGCKSAPDPPPADEPYAEFGAERIIAHLNGPSVRLTGAGPARFVRPLYDQFDRGRAMNLVEYMDRRLRTPASPGFDEVLDSIANSLRIAGFGERAGMGLKELRTTMDSPSWWPISARVSLSAEGGGDRILHSFDDAADIDRVMLPLNAPSASVSGEVAFSLETLEEGEILITKTIVRRDLINRARGRGAIGIVSASMNDYNVDPTGRARHLDAVQYRTVDAGTEFPVAQISERSYSLIEEQMLRDGSATLTIDAETRTGTDEVRTLVASIAGSKHADEAVVVVSHVQEPGASDNASGAAGMLETVLGLARLIEDEVIAPPSRTLVFIWGMEFGGSQAWLESTALKPVAMVNPVMVGNSRAETGALPLLERYPDPGAVEAIPPDTHSVWGGRDVDQSWLERPNGLSVIGRCAMADVSVVVGGWETSENPWEGGTDHEEFIKHGVPAVLFWHFTDFTFNTSLDRIGMVDDEELRRTSVAALATALAVASPETTDIDRYLESNLDEFNMRREAALEADREDLVGEWESWCAGVRHWFRWLCLDAELPAAKSVAPQESE